MKRILTTLILAIGLTATVAGCGRQKDSGSNASFQSEHPDKKLFEIAIQNMEAKKYANAITLLQTLVNSYPDSQYVGKAKLALDDCSRHDECSAILVQVENLPSGGGQTFFPAMPETKTEHNGFMKKHQKSARSMKP
jgi:hypothetical protein